MKRWGLVVIVASVIIGLLFWLISSGIFSPKRDNGLVELTVWGLNEDERVMNNVIASYQNTHPNIKITYVKQSPINYDLRLQTQLRAGTGPDIFQIHSSWIPEMRGEILPAPSNIISLTDFSSNYYPAAKEQIVTDGKIYGLPDELDGIALFYNQDILKAADVIVPSSWEQFIEISKRVTVKNTEGQIQTAGAAIGATVNIDYWPEILGLLFLQQPNASLVSPGSQSGADVLQFYSSFLTDPKNKVWDVTLPTSTQMFKDGKLAFYFGPYQQTSNFAQNTNLHFKTTTVPQLPGGRVAWGSFWIDTVSARSRNQSQSWDFVRFLTSPAVLQLIQTQRTSLGLPSRIYPRVDLAALNNQDPIMGAFVNQGSYYKSWFLNSIVEDNGINSEIIGLFKGAVDGVMAGQSSLSVLQNITPNIKTLLDKYGIK